MSALHITNGDAAADTLRTVVDAPVVVTTDVLHDGPAPDVPLDEWHTIRARFLAGGDERAFERIRAGLAAADRTMAAADRAVLWFEHDLYDQLLLIRTLDLLVRTAVSLICIDRFPGIERFVGLGQLDRAQVASLVGTEQRVTREQFALASEAWRAFRSADPLPLASLARSDGGALPFLRPALRRLLQEYPSTQNGLSRTANQALQALADGPVTGGALFRSVQGAEDAPFIGDWGFFDILRALASARVALVDITPRPADLDLYDHTIAITQAGRRVLDRSDDAVALNGIDVWRGGVHLKGRDASPWRWDAAAETLVS